MINWNTTRAEAETINKIVNRAEGMCRNFGITIDRMTLNLDISATHTNGTPLDLDRLLAASDENFAHDIGGIRTNINRKTGQLENCFLPRYAKQGGS